LKKILPKKTARSKAGAAFAQPLLSPTSDDALFIVGVGASAGGLEALEQFLGPVPRGCDLAFVVVQHLDPTRKGIMVELLQRATAMPVVQIKDRMTVKAGHVYVIPPNRDLSILHGVLHLLEPTAPRGRRLPIDSFFRALADDQRKRSVGVILSGMGADGTMGLRAIKEKGGAVFVQTPASAKFDSMPRSAVDLGVADGMAPAEQLVGRIAAFLKLAPSATTRSAKAVGDEDRSGLEKIVLLLRTQTGHDFSLYKKSTIHRRIERRMGLHQLSKIADYVRYLRENPSEAELLFKELLIGVTSFFRDPAVWEQLKNDVIPALLVARPKGGLLRAWVAGCSTGEEAYSLAIVVREALEQVKPEARFSLRVFATDLDKAAINRARLGVYPGRIDADVSEARLRRFFVPEERGYRVGKEIREMVTFAAQNLVMDPPFTKLDMLTCRNLLIYLESDLQKKLLPLFHYSLSPGGVLLLGSSETIGPASEYFTALPGKTRLYRRRDMLLRGSPVEFPSAFVHTRADATTTLARPVVQPSAPNLQALTEALLLRGFAPVAVLTTDNGDILYFSGKTEKYLELAAGKANLNVFTMAREGLGTVLNEAFTKVLRQKTAVTLNAAVKAGPDGGTHSVDVTVQSLDEPAALRGMVLIVFSAVATAAARELPIKSSRATTQTRRLDALALDLQESREDLRTTREEMQTSQEELKSTNEELQSTNEEMQSTNEELTTSKEEMQSLNEELQSVNGELEAKVDELSRTNNDMKNLLNSTDIATLFLDSDVRIRRFTTQANRLMKLIPGDVGRPVTDIASDLIYPGLIGDVREVLHSLTFVEKAIHTRDGRWFTTRVMPYRTIDDKVDGVVITFSDITTSKKLEAELREQHGVLKASIKSPKGRAKRAKSHRAHSA
jgi:two-component system CheB/CheR fusion protein